MYQLRHVVAVDGLGEVGGHGAVELQPVATLGHGVRPGTDFGRRVALAAIYGVLAESVVPG